MPCFLVKAQLSYFVSRSYRTESLLERPGLEALKILTQAFDSGLVSLLKPLLIFLSSAPTYTPCSYHSGRCYFWNSICQNYLVAPETSPAFSSVHQTSLAFLFVNLCPTVVRMFVSPPWSQSS